MAAAGHSGLVAFSPGDFLVSDALVIPPQSSRGSFDRIQVVGAGHETTRIRVSPDFNLDAPGVFVMEQSDVYMWGGRLKGFSIIFTQPDSANIDDYTRYPWAINIDGSSLAEIEDVYIWDAWDGITASGTWIDWTYQPDTSAWRLENVHVTAYHQAVVQDGSWDTIRIDGLHCQAVRLSYGET